MIPIDDKDCKYDDNGNLIAIRAIAIYHANQCDGDRMEMWIPLVDGIYYNY